MNVAIVILNWNGKQLLEQFLPSIITFSKGIADIYVADNASTDDSVAFVKDNFMGVKIIQNKENGGYAKGYNDALQHIKADVFALVNSDIEVTENWLQPIIQQFKKDPNTAAIQPKILDFKNKTKFEYAGAGGGFIDKYAYPYCRGRLFDSLEEDKGQYNDTIDIFWSSGACFFIRATIFHELKGFDEDYFAHQEEIDLCWRIQNAVYHIQYIGESTVYHIGGATLDKANPKKTYLNFRNSLYTITKNVPKRKLLSTIFTRMVLDGIAAFKFLIELKPTHFFAILKAHVSFYKNLNRFLKKRKELTQTKMDYFKTKSIVWSYFVLGRKKFKN
jgi:hypothetical protein